MHSSPDFSRPEGDAPVNAGVESGCAFDGRTESNNGAAAKPASTA